MGVEPRARRRKIVGKAPGGHRRRVDDGDDAVDGDARLDLGPGESLPQRLRQSQARGLDYDIVRRIGPAEQRFHGRQKIVRHRAADATVGELDDVLGLAALNPAALDDLAVDADVAEFIDDEGEPPAVGRAEQMLDQAGLAGAEEAGDHGGGDFAAHAVLSFRMRGSPAAMK